MPGIHSAAHHAAAAGREARAQRPFLRHGHERGGNPCLGKLTPTTRATGSPSPSLSWKLCIAGFPRQPGTGDAPAGESAGAGRRVLSTDFRYSQKRSPGTRNGLRRWPSCPRFARSVWSARSLLPLSNHFWLTTAPASWTHSKSIAKQIKRKNPRSLRTTSSDPGPDQSQSP